MAQRSPAAGGGSRIVLPPVVRVPLAAFVAALAAGPLTMLLLLLIALAGGDDVSSAIAELPAFLLLCTLIGAAISIGPNLLGCFLMFLLSQRCPPARSPGWWMAAGAAGALLLLQPLDLLSAGPVLITVFAAVGACCAAICRLIARPD